MDLGEIRDQVNKRLTLNLLIQGAAAHTFLTAHHLVKDELREVSRMLPWLYDRLVPALFLNYFMGDIPLMFGLPSRFWSRVDRAESPFRHNRLFTQHGRELWLASKRHLISRSWRKQIVPLPVFHYLQALPITIWVACAEWRHRPVLVSLAKQANAMIWGIDEDQLDAQLTTQVAFGNLRDPQTALGKMALGAAAGFGGVESRDGRLMVVAKAWFWPLLIHELVKGTAELVCLHGLTCLDDETYDEVMQEADHIEYETWMLQAGPELWRRFLAVLPNPRELPNILMHVARLEPEPLERLMMDIVSEPDRARGYLARLIA